MKHVKSSQLLSIKTSRRVNWIINKCVLVKLLMKTYLRNSFLSIDWESDTIVLVTDVPTFAPIMM